MHFLRLSLSKIKIHLILHISVQNNYNIKKGKTLFTALYLSFKNAMKATFILSYSTKNKIVKRVWQLLKIAGANS